MFHVHRPSTTIFIIRPVLVIRIDFSVCNSRYHDSDSRTQFEKSPTIAAFSPEFQAMTSVVLRVISTLLVIPLVGWALGGCQSTRKAKSECPSPVSQNLNVRDMIDKEQQDDIEFNLDLKQLSIEDEKTRKKAVMDADEKRNPTAPPWRQKNILCLSGGGSFGAYTAGVICGWTAKGNRPTFDVVTGISIGALISPFAFLGSSYDDQMKTMFTTLETKDLYKIKYIRGLFSEALADNTKFAEKVDEAISPQVFAELAAEHRKGRRLYIGTTAAETKRFVIWDIGGIAVKGRPQDRALIVQILLASSAIPGFFPPQHIAVDLDGECFTERHLDGGVSQGIFMHSPYIPPKLRSINGNHDLAGHNLYCIVAGKLYADPQPIKDRAIALASQEVSAIIYAQTRGDLQRLHNISTQTGMNFHITAIPPEYPAPTSSTAFEIPALVGMFNEGYKIAGKDWEWRKTPPNRDPGENANERAGTSLTFKVRGSYVPPVPVRGRGYLSDSGIPIVPPMK